MCNTRGEYGLVLHWEGFDTSLSSCVTPNRDLLFAREDGSSSVRKIKQIQLCFFRRGAWHIVALHQMLFMFSSAPRDTLRDRGSLADRLDPSCPFFHLPEAPVSPGMLPPHHKSSLHIKLYKIYALFFPSTFHCMKEWKMIAILNPKL